MYYLFCLRTLCIVMEITPCSPTFLLERTSTASRRPTVDYQCMDITPCDPTFITHPRIKKRKISKEIAQGNKTVNMSAQREIESTRRLRYQSLRQFSRGVNRRPWFLMGKTRGCGGLPGPCTYLLRDETDGSYLG